MKFITVNPTWNVAQSIIYNELLPLYKSSDPNIFARMGLSVSASRTARCAYSSRPAERNAFGRIRFNFPNKYLVYQHDTPEKHYFAHDKRAYSHGCMRVQDPMKYAEVLLSYAAPRGNHAAQSLQKMFGGEERQIDFAQHIRFTSATRPPSSTITASWCSATTCMPRQKPDGAAARQRTGGHGCRDRAPSRSELQADRAARPAHAQRRPRRQPFSLFEQLFR